MSGRFEGAMRPHAPGTVAGIDEALIEAVVHRFYGNVRTDALLGPLFEDAVRDWPEHLRRLVDFWSSLTLLTGAYKGQPLRAHLHLPNLGDAHFLRWLALFHETVETLCTPAQAAVFLDRAHRIADSFRFGLAVRRGEIAEPLDAPGRPDTPARS